MLVRASSKEGNSKVKKYLYTSVGFIYGTAFATIVFPIRGFLHEMRRTLLPEIIHQLLDDEAKPITFLKSIISTIDVTTKLFLKGKMIGDRTAEAFSNKGWKAWRAPNRLITSYLSHPNHSPLAYLPDADSIHRLDPLHCKRINDITQFSPDESMENLLKNTITNAINTTVFIKKCIDDTLKQKINLECKNFPIETSALIVQYLGAGVPNSPDEKIIEQQLNIHIRKSHLSSKGLHHIFFSCFNLYRWNAEHKRTLPLLTQEKKKKRILLLQRTHHKSIHKLNQRGDSILLANHLDFSHFQNHICFGLHKDLRHFFHVQ